MFAFGSLQARRERTVPSAGNFTLRVGVWLGPLEQLKQDPDLHEGRASVTKGASSSTSKLSKAESRREGFKAPSIEGFEAGGSVMVAHI